MQDNKREFLYDCARYIQGEITEVRLRGNRKDCVLLARALKESRNLFRCLNEKDPSISTVINALGKKREASRKLKRGVGLAWPF